MADLDQAVVRGRIDAARAQVAAALLRTEVAQRHDPQKVAPRGVGAPGRARQLAARDDRQRVRGQARQQPGAHPVVQGAQPLVGVDQQHEPCLRSQRPPRPPAARRARRGPRRAPRAATAAARGRRAGRRSRRGPLGLLGDHVEQAALADPARTREPQHRERRLGRLERRPDQLELGVPTDEAATPARGQDLAEGASPMPTPGHAATIPPQTGPHLVSRRLPRPLSD